MLNPDFRDMLFEFNAVGVEYLLVGAYALAVHGFPRATGDLDLWVHPHPENASRVVRALQAFGAPLTEVTAEDFSSPGTVLQIGVAPRRVDVLTDIDGVSFEEAWQARMEVELEGISVPVISRMHLLKNKRATGRLRDEADARLLEEQRDD